MAPFSRIQATAQQVSRPPEKARPTFSPTGRELSTLATGPQGSQRLAGALPAAPAVPRCPRPGATPRGYPRRAMATAVDAERWLPEHVAALAPDPAAAAPPGGWPCPGAGRPRAATTTPSGGSARAAGPSPTRWWWSWPNPLTAAPARAASCPASTASPCCCCGPTATASATAGVEPSAVSLAAAAATGPGRAARGRPAGRPAGRAATAPAGGRSGADEPARARLDRRGPGERPRGRPRRDLGATDRQRPRGARASADADRRAAERAARVAAGLAELDRWLADLVRTGLAAPAWPPTPPGTGWPPAWSTARPARWPTGSAAWPAGSAPGPAGRSTCWPSWASSTCWPAPDGAPGGLPAELRDGVRAAIGWPVRQDDVLATPPVTDRWWVAARSDTQEDRIVVRRTWLRGEASGRWGMVLSFAAYGQTLDAALPVGGSLVGDLHFYPSPAPCGRWSGRWPAPAVPRGRRGGPPAATVGRRACEEVGGAAGREPWLERWPLTVRAAPPSTTAAGCWPMPRQPPVPWPGPRRAGLRTLVAPVGRATAGRDRRVDGRGPGAGGRPPRGAHGRHRPGGPWGYG